MTDDDDTEHYINTAGMTGERALMPAMAKDMIGFPGEIVRNYAENGMAYQLRHDYGISEDEAWLSLKCADLASLPAWDAEALLDAATAYLTHNSDMASRHGYVIEGNIPDDVERIKRRIRLAMLAEKAPEVMSPAAGVLLLRRAGINIFHELLDAVAFMVWDGIDPERNYRALMRIPEPQAEPPAPVSDSASNAPACDLSILATREQLIEAFGRFTGMDASWFKNIKDTPALLAARKVTGQGGRGHIAEPWFCPFEVMQWLADSKRRKGRKLSTEKAWELLEKNFPKVHSAHSVADPRASD